MSQQLNIEVCPICCSEFQTEEKIFMTDCKHKYHDACFDLLLSYLPSKQYSCPICRKIGMIEQKLDIKDDGDDDIDIDDFSKPFRSEDYLPSNNIDWFSDIEEIDGFDKDDFRIPFKREYYFPSNNLDRFSEEKFPKQQITLSTNPRIFVSPWLQSTIVPDLNMKSLT